MTDRVELLLQSPVAVTVLALLERDQRAGIHPAELPTDVRPEAVEAAIDRLLAGSLPEVQLEAIRAGYEFAGPWHPGTEISLPLAFAGARARRQLAVALAQEFGGSLREPMDPTAQEFWTTRRVHDRGLERFTNLHDIYCCGEFTFGGPWTVTSPHPSLHDDLAWAWEMDDAHPDPILRWRYPIAPSARVFEINEPADWIELVTRYPVLPAPPHSGWELPGPNQPEVRPLEGFAWSPFGSNQAREQGARLERATKGRAARSNVQVAMPDWQAVSRDYDGVHLTWFGFLTCEGHVVDVPDLGPDVVTMLRYWFSERTLWLRDVFGEPEPLPSVQISE